MRQGSRDYRAMKEWLAAAVVALVLLAGLCRLAAREDYWGDEGFTLRRIETSWRQMIYPFAVRPGGVIDPFDRQFVYDYNPPLYFLLIRLLAGARPGPLAVRLFSIVPTIAALLLIGRWARRNLGTSGEWAVLLAGASTPALLYYGHEARPYALPLAVACLATWLVARHWRQPGRVYAACAWTSLAACLMHFAAAWWTIGLGLVLCGALAEAHHRGESNGRRAALAGLAGLAQGSLTALGLMLTQPYLLTRASQAASRALTPEVLMGALAQPFCQLGARPVGPALGASLQAGLLGVAALLLPRSPRRRAGLLALGLWLAPLALPLAAHLAAGTAYFERYGFFALAGWLMTLGWVAQEARERRGWTRGLGFGVIAALVLVNLGWCAANLGRPLRPRWRSAIAKLKEVSRPGDGYTVEPDWNNHCFAANAHTPPPATYFNSKRGGLPAGARTLWLLAAGPLCAETHYLLDPAHWAVQPAGTFEGVALYRATALPRGK